MPYRVFLVEDEIMTREGIRDSVAWAAAGYEFCGEAPDGELALPLIRERQPEVVITDIKMPFMDGLQLSRVLHETLPATKVIILSGHDEFAYAQEAIKAGVTEYLLKPLSGQDLVAALRRVGDQLDHERERQAQVDALQTRLSDQQAQLRERCLLDMLAGTRAPAEIVAQGRALGLDLVAPWYVAGLVQGRRDAPGLDQRFDAAVARSLARVDAVWGRYEHGATAFVLRGASRDALECAAAELTAQLRPNVAAASGRQATVFTSPPTERIGMLASLFAELVAQARGGAEPERTPPGAARPTVQKPNTGVLEQLLRGGVKGDIAAALRAYLAPLPPLGHRSAALLDYVLTDALLTVGSALRSLGAQPEAVVPELQQIEELRERVGTIAQVEALVGEALERTLDYRDRQTHHQRALVDRARAFIEARYADPELSLHAVAAHVVLSPSYFSAVFAREVGETFVEYVTRVRLQRAMELLRTTALTFREIAACVGYQNPRYFHAVFRKATGLSPIEFRRQA